MDQYKLTPDVTIHAHACGQAGIFVNAFLIETANATVAVDATLTESDSRAFRLEMEALGKPLVAVLVTHPHPDHVAGITNLIGPDSVPIIATQPVLDLMRRLEEPKRRQWTPVFGAEWVPRWTYPNTVVSSGERLKFDGVTYSVLDLGPGGDAEANSVWFIESPQRTAFLGDLVFNGTHSYIADGHLLAWLANLSRLESLCMGMDRAFPGHGPPAPAAQLISRQIAYLITAAGHVKELANGRLALTAQEKEELERRMTAALPDAGLGFLIPMYADAIARELNGLR